MATSSLRAETWEKQPAPSPSIVHVHGHVHIHTPIRIRIHNPQPSLPIVALLVSHIAPSAHAFRGVRPGTCHLARPLTDDL